MKFADQVANLEISDDKAMVSFDVVSLFTAIPIEKACKYIRKKLNEDTTAESESEFCLQTDTRLCDG